MGRGSNWAEDAAIAEQNSDLMRLHYDLPLELFENCLGRTMKSSMGLWENGAEALEAGRTAEIQSGG